MRLWQQRGGGKNCALEVSAQDFATFIILDARDKRRERTSIVALAKETGRVLGRYENRVTTYILAVYCMGEKLPMSQKRRKR